MSENGHLFGMRAGLFFVEFSLKIIYVEDIFVWLPDLFAGAFRSYPPVGRFTFFTPWRSICAHFFVIFDVRDARIKTRTATNVSVRCTTSF